jgi:hypothetical protein
MTEEELTGLGYPERTDGARDRLVSDAAALTRLAEQPEWQVLDRLLGEHLGRVLQALRARGLSHAEGEALRAEADAVEWLRNRPAALRRAVEDLRAMEAQQAAAGLPNYPDEIAG